MMAVYFDHNASTPLQASIWEAMLPYHHLPGNAASTHQMGRFMRHAVDEAKEKIARLINAHPSEIFFTSGGTESNNWAIQGWVDAQQSPTHLLIGATEHDSIVQAAAWCEKKGTNITRLPVNQDGLLCQQTLEKALIPQTTALASVMLANNESGTLQNIQTVVEKCHAVGTLVHTDAVQALGKIPVDFQSLGVDLMTISAHKMGGPKGIGALIRRSHVPLSPLITGGGHQQGFRAGTENVPAIVGFGKAAEWLSNTLEARIKYLKILQQRLENNIPASFGVKILSQFVDRLPNTSLWVVPGIEGEMLLMQLDKHGFAVSSGSACHQATQTASHVLAAMGISALEANSVIRISFGIDNTIQQVDEFLKTLCTIMGGLK